MNIPIVQTYTPPGFIDLGSGNPSLELLPLEMLKEAADRYFSASDIASIAFCISTMVSSMPLSIKNITFFIDSLELSYFWRGRNTKYLLHNSLIILK